MSDPYQYETDVANHLLAQGYTGVELTPKSGDFGADVLAVNPEGYSVCIQCKHYTEKVGVHAVQEIIAAREYYGCDLAAVYTTSGFTESAYRIAARTNVQLFVYQPEINPRRKRIFNFPTSKAKKQTRRQNRGCSTILAIIAIFIIALTVFTNREETKNRELTATIQADSIIANGVYYHNAGNHMDVVGLAEKSKKNIIIESVVDDLPVTCIAKNAFTKEDIVSIKIPDSILIIENGAFSSCKHLSNVVLSKSIDKISQSTFLLCNELSDIKLPSSVQAIEKGAFGSTNITTIDLSNVKSIGDNAFSSCTELQKVIVSDKLISIGDHAFNTCHKLKSINLQENLVSIGSHCFEACTSLANIHLPDTLKKIGNSCFSNCTALKEITIPPFVSSLDVNAFYGDENLTVINLPLSCSLPVGAEPFRLCKAKLVYYK